MSTLSLVEIESTLHRLCDAWQDAETPESMAVAEVALREHLELEVQKVDGIRRYLKFADTQRDAAKVEMRFQAERVRLWEARADRLKAFVQDVMTGWGRKKLEGSTGSLALQANGGKEPVIITDESLLPDELCTVEIQMSGIAWKELLALAGAEPGYASAKVTRSPWLSLIAGRLSEACPRCDGTRKQVMCCDCGGLEGEQHTPHCHRQGLVTNASDYRNLRSEVICPECGGSGKQGVAGARLGERGEHLRVR